MNRRKLFLALKIIIIIYCALGIALYYLQDKFLFHPEKLSADHVFNFKEPFKEIQIPVNDTDTINLIRFMAADSIPKGVVLYFHGNMENVEHYGSFVSVFTRHGYEVWMPDYPGFGKSSGEISEKKLYELAWLVQKMAANKYEPAQTIVYGKSLGTGIAAYAASVSGCKQLILETPYYSIPDMFDQYVFMYPTAAMCNYRIPTWKFLLDVKANVIIFHGTNDEVISHRGAEKLKNSFKPGDQFISIPDAKHNNISDFEIYHHVMDSLLNK